MKYLDWAINNADKIGTISILLIVVFGLLYVVRTLHKQSRDCEKSRLEDAKDRAQLNKKLGKLESKVETLSSLEAKISTIEQLNMQVLSQTLRGKDANIEDTS